jgi:hypothetical protein
VEDVWGRARTRQKKKVAIRALSAPTAVGATISFLKEMVHVWLHCQPPWQQAFCPACQEARLCALQLLDNKRLTRKVKRVNYEAGRSQADAMERCDVVVGLQIVGVEYLNAENVLVTVLAGRPRDYDPLVGDRAFEWDPVEGSDVPVEGLESEDSKEEIEEGA